MRRVCVVVGLLAGCGESALTMTLEVPEDDERWDTSCVQTIEVFTTGAGYPDQANDYIGQTLDLSDSRADTYQAIKGAVRGEFDVAIPDSGLSSVEMYGWNGLSGFFNADLFPELIFYARVPYTGQDPINIELFANLDCSLSPVIVRPIDLIQLVTTKNCTTAAITDATAFTSLGTLSPGLFKPYLFGWGGIHGAAVANGLSSFQAATQVGPASCLAVYGSTMTSTTGGCVTATKACATGSEIEAVLVDDTYAANSLDDELQETLRGGVIGAVLDGTKTGITGATVDVGELGQVVYVNLDTAGKRLVPTGGTATSASGMFILYSNDLVDAVVTANGQTKTVTVGAQRTFNDGTKAPAGVVVTF
ncbi:MAG: hypothetical protein H0V17_00930 [Deltaproteobacteria bacterium]|nr:hypothetical protein [Deltaproteobacteria bacterium]